MGKHGDEAAETAYERHDQATVDDFRGRLREVVGHESVRSFARRAKVSHSSVGQYLSGVSEPTRPGLVRLAAAGKVRLEWLATGEGSMRPEPPAPRLADSTVSEVVARQVASLGGREGGGSVPVIGLAECGLKGWYQGALMTVSAARPGDLLDPDAFAVIAIGTSMRPAGICQGFLCFCSPRMAVDKGDRVYIERRDGTATIKKYVCRDETWLYLQGWLDPDESGRQELYSDQVRLDQIARLATIVYVKVKL